MTSENACPRPDALGRDFATISACFEGYILHIDQESLKVIADQRGATLRLLVREGGFVTPGFPLLDVWPSDLVDDSLRRMALKAFSHGGRPTPYADMEAALNELVQIALRALSPALNDPITAINCVDRLAAALAVVASRPAPAGCLCDDSKRPCVFTRPFTFPELMNIAFSPIRQSGAANPPIMIRTLEGLGLIAATATRRADRNEIRAHADMTLHACERSSWEPFDLEFARKRHACVIQLVTRPTDRPEGASANGDEFAARCRALRGLLSDSGECPRERGTPASD